jgi:hypothetical protein
MKVIEKFIGTILLVHRTNASAKVLAIDRIELVLLVVSDRARN